jgi:hypothetical protein
MNSGWWLCSTTPDYLQQAWLNLPRKKRFKDHCLPVAIRFFWISFQTVRSKMKDKAKVDYENSDEEGDSVTHSYKSSKTAVSLCGVLRELYRKVQLTWLRQMSKSRWQHCYCNGFIIQIPGAPSGFWRLL